MNEVFSRALFNREARRSLLLGAVIVLILPLVASSSREPQRIPLGPDAYVQMTPTAASDCPVDYVCLWEHRDFTGSMVAFRDCCNWYNLADVVFNNTASSWRNRKNVDAKVAEFNDGNGERFCLNEGSQNSSFPASWDNRATSLKIFSSAGAC